MTSKPGDFLVTAADIRVVNDRILRGPVELGLRAWADLIGRADYRVMYALGPTLAERVGATWVGPVRGRYTMRPRPSRDPSTGWITPKQTPDKPCPTPSVSRIGLLLADHTKDAVVRRAISAVLLIELGQPLEARFIAALWDVTTETVRVRMAPYALVRTAPAKAWAAPDVLMEFGQPLREVERGDDAAGR